MHWSQRSPTALPQQITLTTIMLWVLPLIGASIALAGLALVRHVGDSYMPLDQGIVRTLSWVLLSWNVVVLISHVGATLLLFAVRHRSSLPAWTRLLPRSSVLATGLLLATPAAGFAAVAPVAPSDEADNISVSWPVDNDAQHSVAPRTRDLQPRASLDQQPGPKEQARKRTGSPAPERAEIAKPSGTGAAPSSVDSSPTRPRATPQTSIALKSKPAIESASATPPQAQTKIRSKGFIPTERVAAPLPRELGHMGQQRSVVVRHGDSLWSLASRHLGSKVPAMDIAAEVQRWHHHNLDVIGPDPNIIYPGQELFIPA